MAQRPVARDAAGGPRIDRRAGLNEMPVMTLFILLAVGVLLTAAGAAAQARDVSVLLLSERSVCWERPAHLDAKLKGDLEAMDLTVHEANAYYHDVTAELLARHNVAIMLYPPTAAGSAEAETYIAKGRMILDYVRAGGGLLVLGDNNYDSLKPLNAFLQPLDATVLPESVVDEETEFRQERFFREYFFTTRNMGQHPLTEGVERLCFPSAWHRWKAGATNAVQVGAAWEVIVRGNESARSVGWRADVDGRTTYASVPPIVAARTLGLGRVALCPTRSVTTIQSGHHFVFEDTCYERGNLTRFVANALRWLGEPARNAGVPGGYVEAELPPDPPGPTQEQLALLDPYTRLAALGFREPVSTIEHKHEPRQDYVGVIGVYSDFSRRVSEPIVAGGLGTVAEYCRRARELGYSFLAFTERFEVMDEAKWGKLAAQCKENSDESFVAIPGIEIQDVHGDRYACIDLPGWVQDEWLDPTGRYMLDHPGFYFGLTHSLTTFLGEYLLSPRQSFVQPWFQKFYAGMEVFGYRRGDQPCSEAEDWYRVCQSNDYNLIPIVTHGISSPNDLAQVSGYRTHVLADSVDNVRSAFRYGWYTPRSVYVSSGPRLAEWAIENGRGGLREEPWRLFIRLEGDEPLTRVTVWDRGQVFRRYYPRKREFAVEIGGHHDKQRHFLLTAEDEEGGRLVSSALYTSDVRHSTYMCTDLQNTINSMVDASRAGKQSYFRVQGLYVTGWDSLDVPALVTEKDVLPESGIEYGLAPMAGAAGPVVHTVGKTEHAVAQRLMALGCGDVNILDNRYAWTLLPGSYMTRTELADSRVRLISFTPRAYGMNIMLVEHTVTLKRDVTLADRAGPEITLLRLETGASAAEARGMLTAASEGFPELRVVSAAGQAREWSDRTEPIALTLEAGGYAAFYPNFWGSLAVFPLTDGLTMRTGHYTEIGLDSPGAALAAGTTLTARCLVVRGAFGEATAGEFDKLRDRFGLDGSPACKPKVTRGRLVDSRYILSLRAEDGAAAVSLKEAQLATPQPLMVENLSENCDAVALDATSGDVRRVAIFEGAGWLTVDPARGPVSVVVGNAVSCDSSDLRISLLRDGDRWSVETHNPTEAEVTASVSVPDWLSAAIGQLAKNVSLAPGETQLMELAGPQ